MHFAYPLPWWLVAVFFLHTCGELALSPVGMSAMTKLAPMRIGGLIMGFWFLVFAGTLGSILWPMAEHLRR